MRLLSLKRIAARVESAESTIRLWIAAGKFPAPVYLPNGQPRWRAADLLKWENRLEDTPPENPVKAKKAHRRGTAGDGAR